MYSGTVQWKYKIKLSKVDYPRLNILLFGVNGTAEKNKLSILISPRILKHFCMPLTVEALTG